MPLSRPPRDARREPQRIAKLLARAGVASRREIERMVAEGRIAINGATVETPATLVESLHGVTVDGKPVKPPAPARLFRFHKPPGFLTTERDPRGRPTIYDRLPPGLPRLMPVGRLDLNTEGLLLLTTDGELKRALELPRTGVPRTYRARAYGTVTQAQLEALIEGIEIDGVRYGSIDANLERRTGANVWIELTLAEGKNREVRRVLEHLGLKVSRLIRTRYGPFPLGDLPAGAVDEVRQHDLVLFRKSLPGHPHPPAAEAAPAAARPVTSRAAADRPAAARPGAGQPAPEAPARVRRGRSRPAPAPAAPGPSSAPGPGTPRPRRPRPAGTGRPAADRPRRPAGPPRKGPR